MKYEQEFWDMFRGKLERKKVVCLRCRVTFLSQSKFNRLCGQCSQVVKRHRSENII